ncbi:MAG: Holliday junction resolvase RuvX [Verrucomicrobiales bacterium]|nr:Holliday junction resolvase RuvX [Verrucomicrobiales bacterium]
MSEWTKAIGIDYGLARIGLAVSDDIGLLAHPLETVPGKDREGALARICELIKSREINDVVVGLPLHMSGDESDTAKSMRKFMVDLKKLLPDSITFHEVDERYSTSDAMAKLHEAGRTAKNSKPILDQAAAVEILQRWLDEQPDKAW